MAEIIGIGTDLIEVRRVTRAYDRFGERFLERLYTPAERAYCMKRADFGCALAGRFAAKEAVVKALSPDEAVGLSYRDVEIRADGGRPRVGLAGAAASLAARRGVAAVAVTITHERAYALAFAVAFGK
jgi:holo-[acyl-carrier protein] synthase